MSKIKQNDTIQDIQKLWCFQNMPAYEIAKVCKKSIGSVQEIISKNGFKRCYHQKEWLFKKHVIEKKNTVEISKEANCSVDSVRDWMRKHNIPISSKVANDSKRKYSFNHGYFKDIDTEEKAYWLGFIMADGCVSSTDTSFRLSLASVDKYHLQKFLDCLCSDYRIKEYSVYLKETKKTYPMSKVVIISKEFHQNLLSNNVLPLKSNKESAPNLSKWLIRHFIRGYVDGDGSISFFKRKRKREYKNHETTTVKLSGSLSVLGGEKFLNWISNEALKEIGLSAIVRKKGTENIHVLSYSDNSMKKFLDWIYKDSTIYLDRKKEKYIEYTHLHSSKHLWELKDIVRTSRENLESQAEMS